MIRIVRIDDHALVRDGVARLLEEAPDLRVVEGNKFAIRRLTSA